MISANYTSENIAGALGLGGFANDWQLAEADECMRILLTPSFHREVCISVLCKAGKVSVIVVAAVSQIWLQDWPVPQPTQVEQDAGILSEQQFIRLSALLHIAAESKQERMVVISDGMRAHTVLRADREGKVNLAQHVGEDASYRVFVAAVIEQCHGVIGNPSIRNALADAGSYASLRLPPDMVRPAKERVRTLVLGSEAETAGLLEALRKQHGV